MAEAAAGLRDDELEGLYGWLGAYATLVIAVSGGPDSLALLESLARWRAARAAAAPRLEAVTVDHGLRPASAAEALLVGGIAHRLGVRHTIMRWDGPKPTASIQDAARRARYHLLAEHARRCADQPAAVVTAHHAEDQAETLLMRLARGSGVDGLAAMAPVRHEAGVPVLRPLLAVAKARLVATLTARGIGFVDDPSNADPAFERVRLRRAWPAFEAAGLSATMIGRSAQRLERARQALDAATDRLTERVVEIHDGAYATIAVQGWRAASEELRIRSLARVIQAYGGQAESVRLSQIEALAGALQQREPAGATLGGCVVVGRRLAIDVFREPGREGLPEVVVMAGGEALWDRRFRVSWRTNCNGSVVVRALGAAEWARLRSRVGSRSALPARAVATLPSFWQDGCLIAVPHLRLGPERGSPIDDMAGEACLVRFIGQARENEATSGNGS